MLQLIYAVVCFVLGVALLSSRSTGFREKLPGFIQSHAQKLGVLSVFLGLFFFVSLSFVFVDSDQTGHLKKIYLGEDLQSGRIIGANGEKGPQARIIPPGFHFEPLINLINEIEMLPIVRIPEGKLGVLIAKDGMPLRETQYIADKWADGTEQQMLDAKYFLTEGGGQKGPQLFTLKPGDHRINLYLFDVQIHNALDIPTGTVAVIRSNVETTANCPSALQTAGGAPDAELATPIVPKGCVGVWDEPLTPGRYYLNPKAYVSTLIPTRVQVWTYKGGYTTRKVNLEVTDEGKIVQSVESFNVPVPKDAADKAINVRVEGWTVPVEARIVVQVSPRLAPKVVAAVGSLEQVENNVITPSLRDLLRTIGGHEERKALDFVSHRDDIVAKLEEVLIPEGLKAGVNIQEVRLGEPALPPEVLLPQLRQQLADQLKVTYEKERVAQSQRIAVEKSRAEADQQSMLVKAQIEKQAAEQQKEKMRLLGEGEKLKLIEIAKGEKARVDVLGQEKTAYLKALELTIDAAKENPDIVKVPGVVNYGGGSSLEGMAAILANPSILGNASNVGQIATQPTGK